jgi:hypothetical protein
VELLLLKAMTKEELNKPQANDGSTALHAAGWGDHPSIVSLLLYAEANPNKKNSLDRLPEDEAGARTLTLFVRYKSGDRSFLHEYIPVDITLKKNSWI